MPRIRTIKPEFFRSEKIARLTETAQLCFIGLWVASDDAGLFSSHPRHVLADVFPMREDLTLDDISRVLRELARVNLIHLYEVEGKSFGAVKGWEEHQRIDRPSKSRLPAPTDPNATDSTDPRGILDEPSMQDLGPRKLDLGPRTLEIEKEKDLKPLFVLGVNERMFVGNRPREMLAIA